MVEDWMMDGACIGHDPDLWFPERGESSTEAKKICLRCLVRAECLEFAVTNRIRFGIWGAASERERRKIRLGRK